MMTRRASFLRLTLTVEMAIVVGCNSAQRHVETDYHTVTADLRRDTDRARQLDSQGVKLIDQGKWDDAETTFKASLAADITFGPAHNNLGRVYYHTGKMYLAAWEFEYAIKSMPYQPEPKNNLGMVLESAGRLDEAVLNYDGAVALEKDNPEFIGNDARARLRRGDADSQVTDLLRKLAAWDNRPDWNEWAKEKLAVPSTRPASTAP